MKNSGLGQRKASNLRKVYGLTFLNVHLMASFLLFFGSTSNPVAGLIALILIIINHERASTVITKMGVIYQIEACERINRNLIEAFAAKGRVSNWVNEPRLSSKQTQEDGLDSLVDLSNVTIAIDIRAIVPASKGFTKVSFDTSKKQLFYRKLNTGKRYFGQDPFLILKQKTSWIYNHHQDLFSNPPIYFLVIAIPSKVEIKMDSPIRVVGGKNYLYWNNVYIISEIDVIPLIEALNQKQIHHFWTES